MCIVLSICLCVSLYKNFVALASVHVLFKYIMLVGLFKRVIYNATYGFVFMSLLYSLLHILTFCYTYTCVSMCSCIKSFVKLTKEFSLKFLSFLIFLQFK